MSEITDQERRTLLGGLLTLAASSAALAAVMGITALDHMVLEASLCGPSIEHCTACYVALASLAVAVIATGASIDIFRAHSADGAAA